jgi:hypothetical protein
MPQLSMQRQRDPAAALNDWLRRMAPRLGRLQDILLPADFPFDYSDRSLQLLESELLNRYGGAAELRANRERDFAEAVVRYIGESLMRAAGGRWLWNDDPSETNSMRTLVQLDLEGPPVSPLELIETAVDRRTGRVLEELYRALQGRVADRRSKHPGWKPTKQPTPGVDLTPQPKSEYLEAWLASGRREFRRWISDDAAGSMDFSRASVERLEERLLDQRHQGPLELTDIPDHIQAAAWYFGEILLRAVGGEWRYHPGLPDSPEVFVGRPFVLLQVGGMELGEESEPVDPLIAIKVLISRGERGFLTQTFDMHTSD